MSSFIFLDIDGVLNSHDDVNASGIYSINQDAMQRLNRIVEATGAELVISSAWRYMIRGGAMTIAGFRYLLMTHGLKPSVQIHGCTVSDEEIGDRGQQIAEYLQAYGPRPYVVLDDGSETPQGEAPTMTEALLRQHAERWVLVDGSRGLDDACADQAIALLALPLPEYQEREP